MRRRAFLTAIGAGFACFATVTRLAEAGIRKLEEDDGSSVAFPSEAPPGNTIIEFEIIREEDGLVIGIAKCDEETGIIQFPPMSVPGHFIARSKPHPYIAKPITIGMNYSKEPGPI